MKETTAAEEVAKSGYRNNAVMELIEPAKEPWVAGTIKEPKNLGTFRCKVCGYERKSTLTENQRYEPGEHATCPYGCKLPDVKRFEVMEVIKPADYPEVYSTFRCRVCGHEHSKFFYFYEGKYSRLAWKCSKGCKLSKSTRKRTRQATKNEEKSKATKNDNRYGYRDDDIKYYYETKPIETVSSVFVPQISEEASDNGNNGGTVSDTAEQSSYECFGKYIGNPSCSICDTEKKCLKASNRSDSSEPNQPNDTVSPEVGKESCEFLGKYSGDTDCFSRCKDEQECKEPTRVPILGPSYRNITELKEHHLNTEIYGDTYDAELFRSMNEKGILVPLLITKDNVIISGHRRFRAAKALSISEVPVTIFGSDDTLDIEEALLDSNKYRTKTHTQIVNTYKHYKKIEEEKALRRKRSTLKQSTDRENFPNREEQGRASDRAAEKVGKSGKTMETACKVQEKIDELKAAGKRDEAAKIDKIFNEKGSVNGALQAIMGLGNGDVPRKKKEKKEPIVDRALLEEVKEHAENIGLSAEEFLQIALKKIRNLEVEITETVKLTFVVNEALLEKVRKKAAKQGLNFEEFLWESLEMLLTDWYYDPHEDD